MPESRPASRDDAAHPEPSRRSRGNVVPAMLQAEISDAYVKLIDAIPDYALLLLDVGGHILTWNTGAQAIKGYEADEVVGRHISIFYTPEAVTVGHPGRELELASLTGRYQEDGWRVRKDGTRFWARVQILALHNDAGDLIGFGKLTADLTESRQKEEQVSNVLALLEQTIRLDHLTGLPNRRAWDERLRLEIDEAGRRGHPLSVAVLDLDHFKQVNDQHGHLVGDTILKRISLRWRQALRPGDMLARYGGEEFVLALPRCQSDEAVRVVARLLEATPHGQTASAGVATWDPSESSDDLIGRADSALYVAKSSGRDRIETA